MDGSMAKVSQKIDEKGPDRGLASSKMAEPAVRLLTVACSGSKPLKALRSKVR